HAVEALVPEAAIGLEPVRDSFERRGLEPARTPLRLPTADDQPSPLEHLQVLRDRRQAHRKGSRQLVHRGFPESQLAQYRPPRRISESRESRTESITWHLYFTYRLTN